MKNTLFIIRTLNMGGSVTSLLNLLELLNNQGNKADLFVMEHTGSFLERAKGCANVLAENKKLASSICERSDLKKYGACGFFNRCFVFLKNRFFSSSRVIDQIYKKAASKLSDYDVVVAYQEETATFFAQFVPAKKRVAWVHTMYERFAYCYPHDTIVSLYSNFDTIVCVAPAAQDAFQKGLPEFKDRILLIPNPLNVKKIQESALSNQDSIVRNNNKIIVSVGRLSAEKQYDYAICAAKKLNEIYSDFIWYIVGDGSEKEKLENLISEKGMNEKVVMLGTKENPYPIIAQADVLVISSLYEAQPMVANEALILDVPVITTNYPSAQTLINHGENGLLCDNSVEGIFSALYDFLTDDSLRRTLKKGAALFKYDSQSIIDEILSVCSIDIDR